MPDNILRPNFSRLIDSIHAEEHLAESAHPKIGILFMCVYVVCVKTSKKKTKYYYEYDDDMIDMLECDEAIAIACVLEILLLFVCMCMWSIAIS